jgi:hypothetical protein
LEALTGELIKMDDQNIEVLKIYCDKQKVMIADLVAKVLMLETKLELLEVQRKVDLNDVVEKERENINNQNEKKSSTRSGQLR